MYKSKYNNKKVIYNGIKFASKMERDYYIYILGLKEDGVVADIELQPVFLLQEKFKYGNKTIRSIKYKADFRVAYKDGHTEVIDVKGTVTDVFKIKRKMLLSKYKDIDFKCVRKIRGEWKVVL
ncbi:DUF1064 domain-containing protein [Hathewaya histolytica]|uniref:Phage-like protein n=1 Tax=Hathewaya histolytica TaxID=1498 RepID=A0A4U9R684_HATHI|nr:DUF1064 domain-containing protein [Hathewaya histolytica]VTQ86895.1 phage-like protein [Hathewaya histolytica]